MGSMIERQWLDLPIIKHIICTFNKPSSARSIGKTAISPATVANNAIVMKGEELGTSPLLKKVSYLSLAENIGVVKFSHFYVKFSHPLHNDNNDFASQFTGYLISSYNWRYGRL